MLTATERAQEINRRRTERGGWGSAFLLVEDPEHWEGYGIKTGVELDTYLAFCDFWDVYKECHGIRPRWMGGWETRTAEEWDKLTAEEGEFMRMEVEVKRAEEARHRAWTKEVTSGTPLTHNPFKAMFMMGMF